jgi:membrane associated rhomboid family serine protease
MSNASSFIKYISKSDILKIIVATTLFFVIVQSIRITLLMNDEPTTFYDVHVWKNIGITSTFSSWISHFWSMITFMFAEDNFWQVVGNMIWLWVFGSVIEDLKGIYRVLPIYLIGGIFSAFIFILLGTILKPAEVNFYAGAMPSIMAVAVATIVYKPNYQFWFLFGKGIPVWIFGGVYFILQLVAIKEYNLQNLSLMLGAILVGVGYNYGFGFIFDKMTTGFKKLGEYFENNRNFVNKKDGYNFSAPKTLQVDTANIDMILDKINSKGIDSLSAKEKSILESFSKK